MDELYTTADVAISPRADWQAYAAGFLFDEDGRVVLIRKKRPTWQAGRLNGVGGHVEPGESPAQTMRREFEEEAGLDLDGWDHFATVTFPYGAVWFFRLVVSAEILAGVRAGTDEHLEVLPLAEAVAERTSVIENLRWLLPLAWYRHDRYVPVVAAEVG